MFYRTNIFGLVLADEKRWFASIWDDHAQKVIGELSFKKAVLNIRLTKRL